MKSSLAEARNLMKPWRKDFKTLRVTPVRTGKATTLATIRTATQRLWIVIGAVVSCVAAGHRSGAESAVGEPLALVAAGGRDGGQRANAAARD